MSAQTFLFIFSAEIYQQAVAIIKGEERFSGLHCPGLSLRGFELHQKLLQEYEKLQQQKRSQK